MRAKIEPACMVYGLAGDACCVDCLKRGDLIFDTLQVAKYVVKEVSKEGQHV